MLQGFLNSFSREVPEDTFLSLTGFLVRGLFLDVCLSMKVILTVSSL